MAEIVSFASGKGGVGKTLLTAALGIFLSRRGKKVLLIDGDMGMRNMDLVLGLENECFYHVMDLAEGRCFAKDVILEVMIIWISCRRRRMIHGRLSFLRRWIPCSKTWRISMITSFSTVRRGEERASALRSISRIICSSSWRRPGPRSGMQSVS